MPKLTKKKVITVSVDYDGDDIWTVINLDGNAIVIPTKLILQSKKDPDDLLKLVRNYRDKEFGHLFVATKKYWNHYKFNSLYAFDGNYAESYKQSVKIIKSGDYSRIVYFDGDSHTLYDSNRNPIIHDLPLDDIHVHVRAGRTESLFECALKKFTAHPRIVGLDVHEYRVYDDYSQMGSPKSFHCYYRPKDEKEWNKIVSTAKKRQMLEYSNRDDMFNLKHAWKLKLKDIIWETVLDKEYKQMEKKVNELIGY